MTEQEPKKPRNILGNAKKKKTSVNESLEFKRYFSWYLLLHYRLIYISNERVRLIAAAVHKPSQSVTLTVFYFAYVCRTHGSVAIANQPVSQLISLAVRHLKDSWHSGKLRELGGEIGWLRVSLQSGWTALDMERFTQALPAGRLEMTGLMNNSYLIEFLGLFF